MDTTPTPDLAPEVIALAQEQAAADAALMELLQKKRAVASAQVLEAVQDGEDAAEQEAFTITTDPRVPMNRAERRQQVKRYAAILAATERQRPIVNPTITPKSKRRRRAH